MPTKSKAAPKTVQRVTIYTRVSEARDAAARKGNGNGETSTARQLERCKAYMKSQGWDGASVTHHTDRGISAFSGVERPGWTKVLDDVEHGRTDVVLVFALDRAGRNIVKLMSFVESCKDQDVAFASATQPIDTTSPYGSIIIAVLAAVAEMESAIKRERSLSKAREKKTAGEWTGGIKGFGYTLDMEQVPAEAEAIRSGSGTLLNGGSLQTVANDWNAAGHATTRGKSWEPNTVKTTLQRAAIVGLTDLDGELVRGGWDGILTRNDWDALQAVFGARRTGARHDKNLLTGLALCGRCGGSLVGRGGRYICNATGRVHLGIGRDALDKFVTDASSYRHLESPATVADLSEIAPELRERLAAIEAEQADVVDDDTLSPAFADRRYRKLEAERAKLVAATEKSAQRYAYLSEGETDARASLETVVDHITVKPAPSSRAAAADRTDITWRDGVERNVTAHDLAWVAKERAEGR
jgi:DNA invertase Pin-like site-specific DNA recombinase